MPAKARSVDQAAVADARGAEQPGFTFESLPGTAEEATRIMDTLSARGKSTQKLALFEKLGHSFGTMFSEGATAPYRAHPEIDPEVLNAVSSWLKER